MGGGKEGGAPGYRPPRAGRRLWVLDLACAKAPGSGFWRAGMNSFAVETEEPRAQDVAVNAEALTVDLVDGRTLIVPLVWFPRLWYGKPEERGHFEIFGDGAFIHWPDLDEDLSVAGLLSGLQIGR